jgi:thymidylate synthase (FAD)
MPLDRDKLAEIEAQRAEAHTTRRATVPALEALLYEPLPVLDHGFVRLIDYMGDDAAIVQAARVSYGKGTKRSQTDQGLIRYLMRHRHTSPFEMCEIKLHLKMPIFVARQWIRHRTASLNEYSARYSILDREFYVPDRDYLESQRSLKAPRTNPAAAQPALFDLERPEPEATAAQSTRNKQGREEVLDQAEAFDATDRIKRESERAHTFYARLLNERADGSVITPGRPGLARELARIVLPLNTYTQLYWKIDLHNLLHFLSLRAEAHAQYEIRAYAEVIAGLVERWVPLTAAAYAEYQSRALRLSATATALVRRRLRGEAVSQADSGLSAREWRELVEALPELRGPA